MADEAPESAVPERRGGLFLYTGASHLFTDPSFPSYDADATNLLTHRAVTYLDELARKQSARSTSWFSARTRRNGR